MNFDIKVFIKRTNYLKIPKLPKKSIKCNVPNIIKLQKKYCIFMFILFLFHLSEVNKEN